MGAARGHARNQARLSCLSDYDLAIDHLDDTLIRGRHFDLVLHHGCGLDHLLFDTPYGLDHACLNELLERPQPNDRANDYAVFENLERWRRHSRPLILVDVDLGKDAFRRFFRQRLVSTLHILLVVGSEEVDDDQLFARETTMINVRQRAEHSERARERLPTR